MPAWKPTLKPSDEGIDKNLLAIVEEVGLLTDTNKYFCLGYI